MVPFSEIIDICCVSKLWVRQIYITTDDVQTKHDNFFPRVFRFRHTSAKQRVELCVHTILQEQPATMARQAMDRYPVPRAAPPGAISIFAHQQGARLFAPHMDAHGSI